MGSLDFWTQIREYYQLGLYCDMELLPGGSKTGLKCHQLVLGSVSKVIQSALKSAMRSNDSDPIYITLPEFSYETVQLFLNSVYNQLVTENCGEDFEADVELGKSLELRILPGAKAWAREDILDVAHEHQVSV